MVNLPRWAAELRKLARRIWKNLLRKTVVPTHFANLRRANRPSWSEWHVLSQNEICSMTIYLLKWYPAMCRSEYLLHIVEFHAYARLQQQADISTISHTPAMLGWQRWRHCCRWWHSCGCSSGYCCCQKGGCWFCSTGSCFQVNHDDGCISQRIGMIEWKWFGTTISSQWCYDCKQHTNNKTTVVNASLTHGFLHGGISFTSLSILHSFTSCIKSAISIENAIQRNSILSPYYLSTEQLIFTSQV